ncbi:MAG TPA: sugar phosphate isomerase/epimerase family protein [Anaerolineae bacterium]|nr:sugar phosphate isomerase/epimerase family protein [Anaerolineae bacterium]HPL28862.1 sugar phosphate isomerase/epimerase family protein [Anaerolineae bacterium]
MFRSLEVSSINVRADFARTVELAARHGFEGVHVDIDEVAAVGVARARETLARHGVRASAFRFPVDYTRPEPEFAAMLERFPAQCAAAQALGITRTAYWVRPFHDELDFERNYAFHLDRMGRLGTVMKQHGIRIGLEFIGPKTLLPGHPYTFIRSMDGMLKLCHDIGTGNIGLLLDAYHLYTAHGTIDDVKRLRDEDIVEVHVNDAPAGIAVDEQLDLVRALPGETGVIDLVGFMQALAGIGYTGPVMVEPFSERVNAMALDDAVRTTAEALHGVWRKAGLGN